MKFDLSKFNVYKIKIACDKKNAAKNKFVFARITDFAKSQNICMCRVMYHPDICAENTLLLFCIKRIQ